MIQQGCRPEEVLSLRKDDFDPAEKTVMIRRGKTPAAKRMLALTGESTGILQARMNVEGVWFFPSDRKPGHHLVSLRRVHALCSKKPGCYSLDAYDLRHTFATRMATDPTREHRSAYGGVISAREDPRPRESPDGPAAPSSDERTGAYCNGEIRVGHGPTRLACGRWRSEVRSGAVAGALACDILPFTARS